MHILLIHQIFVTPEEGGGTRHYELAKFLVKKGHKVTVIASNIDYLTGRKKGKKGQAKEGIDIIYSFSFQAIHKSIFYRALSFVSFSLSSFFNAIKVKDIDLIWGTSPPLFQSLTALLLSRLRRTPFIFEVRDLWVDFAEELGVVNNRFLIKSIKLLERRLYASASRIIINSPGFKPFISMYTSEDKINLIPNGVITSEFDIGSEAKLEFRSNNQLNNKFIAIYLGNIGVANDIDTIIEAAEQLRGNKDIVFVLMGGGMKKEHYVNYIAQNKINNILILDSRPKSEVPKILAEADVCIATLRNIPLFKTTYPNKVFDYMAAKKPTVLAIDGVIRSVIEKSQGGIYVPPGSGAELSSAILRYYEDRSLAEQHGKNARAYVEKHFERETISNQLEQLLSSVNSNGREATK